MLLSSLLLIAVVVVVVGDVVARWCGHVGCASNGWSSDGITMVISSLVSPSMLALLLLLLLRLACS